MVDYVDLGRGVDQTVTETCQRPGQYDRSETVGDDVARHTGARKQSSKQKNSARARPFAEYRAQKYGHQGCCHEARHDQANLEIGIAVRRCELAQKLR